MMIDANDPVVVMLAGLLNKSAAPLSISIQMQRPTVPLDVPVDQINDARNAIGVFGYPDEGKLRDQIARYLEQAAIK
jgi:hypothetical protein